MPMSFEDRVDAAKQGTHAVIDLDAYASNVSAMRERLEIHGPVALMAVVKANAYGHGLLMCGKTAVSAGIDWLGVARIEEGLQLRREGIDVPTLALSRFNPALIVEAARSNITVALGSADGLEPIRSALRNGDGHTLDIHLKIDSGMHRYGVLPEEALATARAIRDEPSTNLTGLFTHFATADEADLTPLNEQQRRFEQVRTQLADVGFDALTVHITNSAATLRGIAPEPSNADRQLFRTGLALYGLSPSDDVPVPPEFRRVMTLKTRLGRVFTLPQGEGVSYGLTYVADEPTRAGTVPIGYGDGLSRQLSNQGWMSVRGRACPTIGRVCMDQTVIDLRAVPNAAENDEVIVFGDGTGESMTADDIARLTGTINYEVVTAILARVPRLYLRRGKPVAVEDVFGLIESD